MIKNITSTIHKTFILVLCLFYISSCGNEEGNLTTDDDTKTFEEYFRTTNRYKRRNSSNNNNPKNVNDKNDSDNESDFEAPDPSSNPGIPKTSTLSGDMKLTTQETQDLETLRKEKLKYTPSIKNQKVLAQIFQIAKELEKNDKNTSITDQLRDLGFDNCLSIIRGINPYSYFENNRDLVKKMLDIYWTLFSNSSPKVQTQYLFRTTGNKYRRKLEDKEIEMLSIILQKMPESLKKIIFPDRYMFGSRTGGLSSAISEFYRSEDTNKKEILTQKIHQMMTNGGTSLGEEEFTKVFLGENGLIAFLSTLDPKEVLGKT